MLRKMGVEIDGITDVFLDNNRVVINAYMSESKLKKRHNPIDYHVFRWYAAQKYLRICFESVK